MTTPPGPPQTFPGYYLYAWLRDRIGFLERLLATYGDAFRYRSGRQHIYLFNRPELIREVLVTKNFSFSKGRTVTLARRELGAGLIFSEEPLHKARRRLLFPAFHHQAIAQYGRVIVEIGRRLGEGWSEGVAIDVPQEMRRITSGVSLATLFGSHRVFGDGLLLAAAEAIADRLDSATVLVPRAFELLPTGSRRRCRHALARLDTAVRELASAPPAPDRSDLVSLLLRARDEAGRGLDATGLREEVVTFLIASIETSASALSSTWLLLADHPEVEARLHAEVDEVLGDGPLSVEHLPRLRFARQVMAEAMRLYPPVWLLARRALEDCVVGDFMVPSGALVLLSPYFMQRHPEYFPQPTVFDPDRFTPEAEKQRPAFAYFPFGGGPRSCIGEGFAWMEGVLVIAALARRFSFRKAPGTVAVVRPRFSLRPKRLRMIPRRR